AEYLSFRCIPARKAFSPSPQGLGTVCTSTKSSSATCWSSNPKVDGFGIRYSGKQQFLKLLACTLLRRCRQRTTPRGGLLDVRPVQPDGEGVGRNPALFGRGRRQSPIWQRQQMHETTSLDSPSSAD